MILGYRPLTWMSGVFVIIWAWWYVGEHLGVFFKFAVRQSLTIDQLDGVFSQMEGRTLLVTCVLFHLLALFAVSYLLGV